MFWVLDILVAGNRTTFEKRAQEYDKEDEDMTLGIFSGLTIIIE